MDDALVQRVTQDVRQSEVERARDAWRKRFGTLPESAQERGRQMRFLLARGFAGDAISVVLRGRADED